MPNALAETLAQVYRKWAGNLDMGSRHPETWEAVANAAMVHISNPENGSLSGCSDDLIVAEYFRRIREKKAISVAAGGPRGGWPKGKKRKP